MSTEPTNAQNDRQELLGLRKVCAQQAERIKALEAKLGALDRLFTLACVYFCGINRDTLIKQRDSILGINKAK